MENLTVRYINLDFFFFFFEAKKEKPLIVSQQRSDVISACLGKSSFLASQRNVLEGIQGERLETGKGSIGHSLPRRRLGLIKVPLNSYLEMCVPKCNV